MTSCRRRITERPSVNRCRGGRLCPPALRAPKAVIARRRMPDVAISVGGSYDGAARDCHVAALLAMTTLYVHRFGSMWASTPTKYTRTHCAYRVAGHNDPALRGWLQEYVAFTDWADRVVRPYNEPGTPTGSMWSCRPTECCTYLSRSPIDGTPLHMLENGVAGAFLTGFALPSFAGLEGGKI